ncbi:MAG: hypothetical protein D6806_16705 [Deltaproteobacteria bacterium]|nr:MAG: hypothetical protein D6806_16705 [Deltaproteobacteria bacterium]
MRPSFRTRIAYRKKDVVLLLLFMNRRRSLWVSVFVVCLLLFSLFLLAVQTAAVSQSIYPIF